MNRKGEDYIIKVSFDQKHQMKYRMNNEYVKSLEPIGASLPNS
jgi:hypothetical protein